MPAQPPATVYPEFEDAFAITNHNWNGPYWLENAFAQDQLTAASAPGEAAYGHPYSSNPFPSGATEPVNLNHVAAQPRHTIVCPTIASIPPGRQAAKVLQCGICYSDKLFDRKYELERHMRTHDDGGYPCTVAGCDRHGLKAFKRADHLRNHVRKVHGL